MRECWLECNTNNNRQSVGGTEWKQWCSIDERFEFWRHLVIERNQTNKSRLVVTVCIGITPFVPTRCSDHNSIRTECFFLPKKLFSIKKFNKITGKRALYFYSFFNILWQFSPFKWFYFYLFSPSRFSSFFLKPSNESWKGRERERERERIWCRFSQILTGVPWSFEHLNC